MVSCLFWMTGCPLTLCPRRGLKHIRPDLPSFSRGSIMDDSEQLDTLTHEYRPLIASSPVCNIYIRYEFYCSRMKVRSLGLSGSTLEETSRNATEGYSERSTSVLHPINTSHKRKRRTFTEAEKRKMRELRRIGGCPKCAAKRRKVCQIGSA